MAKQKTSGEQKRAKKGTSTGGQWTKTAAGFGGALGKDADDAMNAFKEHRSRRVKVAKLKKKLAAGADVQGEINTLTKEMAQYKADFKASRAKALSAGVKISASGDVVAGGKKYAKGGKVLIKSTPAPKAAQAAVKVKPQIAAKPKMVGVVKPKTAPAGPKPAAAVQKPKSTQAQIDEGIDAFKSHRKWRVKAIGLKKKMAKLDPSKMQYKMLNDELGDVLKERDTAKAKLDKIKAGFPKGSGVKFKSNGDVVVNGVQTHKGGTAVKATGGAVKTTPTKKAVKAVKSPPAAPTPPPAAPPKPKLKPKRPPRQFKSVSAAHAWQAKYYGGWVKGLPKAQAGALTDYIGFPTWDKSSHPGKDPKIYSKLNHGLAGDTKMTPKLKTMAKRMDAALESASTPYDMVVHRGFNSKVAYQQVQNGTLTTASLNSPKATHRYSSTALDADTADNFMNYKPGVGFTTNPHPVRWEIEVPKGSMGAPISFQNELKNPYASNSAEFLLPRDTTYELVSATMKYHPSTGQQVAHVKVRVANQVTH